MNSKIKSAGQTLVELLVTIFVLGIVTTGVLVVLTNARAAQQYARDATVAVAHGEYVLEEMRKVATLAEITNGQWTQWAVNNGLNTLPQENVSVTYTDEEADPLEVTVNVSWVRSSRNYSSELLTRVTK